MSRLRGTIYSGVERSLLVMGLAAGLLTTAAGASAQSPPQIPVANADTVSGNVPSLVKSLRYNGNVKGNVTKVSMGHRATGTVSLLSGLTSITILSSEESKYRLQDRKDNIKSFSTNLVYPIRPGLNMDGQLSDNRFYNRVVTGTNATQDLTNNTQKALINLQFASRLAMFRVHTRSSASVNKSEQTFQNTDTNDGAVAGQVKYNRGSRFAATARGFFRKAWQESEVNAQSFSGFGADEDSVAVRGMMAVGDSSVVRAEHVRYTKTDRYLNQPSGVHGGQQFDADLRPELETRDARATRIEADTYPLGGIKLALNAEHRTDAHYFIVDDKRSNIDTKDRVSADLTYAPSPRTTVNATVEHSMAAHEFPSKPGTYDDESRRVTFNWNQTLTQTLRFTVQSGISLVQTTYLDTDSDRDQRYQFASLRINSKLFPKVNATVFVEVAQTDKFNIKSSRSQNNETETRFNLRPEFTYKINDRISLTQKYGLNIEFSDFVYQADQNFLDRNITFANTVSARLTSTLTTEVFYSYLLHTKGSYLEPYPGAERLLSTNQKDRRDELRISFRYQINKHLAAVGRNEYSQRQDLFATSSAGSVFKNGGLELGLEGDYKIGAQNGLKFAVRRVKRYGRFNSPEQKDFWVMDSALNLTF
ncbi:MAG: hypothetical protein JSW50_05920 [Candidatus Latescibacterota bacterium]|nr:MAG: hypothetical protein JSW50_05920 [Candidatus Latescibacterota bacterium]